MLFLKRKHYFRVFDDPAGAGGENTDPSSGDPPATPPPTKTFTQVEVDRIIGERLKKQRTESEKMLTRLQELEQSKNLSDEERTTLQSQLETLQNSLLTKEELAAKEKKKLQEKYDTDLTEAKKTADVWKSRYSESTITRALTDAAVENKAIRPSQIVALLKGDTRLVEELGEDGKPTGNYIPQVKFQGRDKDGKPVTLDLTVSEAVKQMREMEDHFNLFDSGKFGGLNGGNQNGSFGGGTPTVSQLRDIETYRKHREKISGNK